MAPEGLLHLSHRGVRGIQPQHLQPRTSVDLWIYRAHYYHNEDTMIFMCIYIYILLYIYILNIIIHNIYNYTYYIYILYMYTYYIYRTAPHGGVIFALYNIIISIIITYNIYIYIHNII